MPWTNKSKNPVSDSTLKTRIPTSFDTLFILTPDGSYILLGSSEDEVLIYQEAYTDWSLKTKIES